MIKGLRGASPISDMRQAPRVTIRRPEAGGSTRHRLPDSRKKSNGVAARRHIRIDVIRIVDYNIFCVSITKSIPEKGENMEYLSVRELLRIF